MSEEQIEAAMQQAAEFEDEADTGEVEVWAENWTIVQVFTRCQWRTSMIAVPGFAQRVWEGIAAVEIRACCDLLDVPRPQWPDVLWGVGVMAAASMPVLNEAK